MVEGRLLLCQHGERRIDIAAFDIGGHVDIACPDEKGEPAQGLLLRAVRQEGSIYIGRGDFPAFVIGTE